MIRDTYGMAWSKVTASVILIHMAKSFSLEATLHFLQACMRGLFPPQPCQQSMLLTFWIFTSLLGEISFVYVV